MLPPPPPPPLLLLLLALFLIVDYYLDYYGSISIVNSELVSSILAIAPLGRGPPQLPILLLSIHLPSLANALPPVVGGMAHSCSGHLHTLVGWQHAVGPGLDSGPHSCASLCDHSRHSASGRSLARSLALRHTIGYRPWATGHGPRAAHEDAVENLV